MILINSKMNGNIDSLVASMDKLSSSESSPISNQSNNDLFIQDDIIDKETSNNNSNYNDIGSNPLNEFSIINSKNRSITTSNGNSAPDSIVNNQIHATIHHDNNHKLRHHAQQDLINDKNSNLYLQHNHSSQQRQNDAHHHHHSQHHLNHKTNITNHHSHQISFQQQQSFSQQYGQPSIHNNPQQQEKKYKSYKLVSDPALKKGAPKLYRYDGVVSSKEIAIILKDPRQHVSLHWSLKEPADLIVPRFKIDKNYVGTPPAIEVSITNLNDNINKSFLVDILKKFDAMEEIEIFYHPKTKKHLGLAKIIFMTPSGANACVTKLNQTSLMGNIIDVFFDPFAKKINQIYENIVNPPAAVSSDNFIDPNFLDAAKSRTAPKTSDYSSFEGSSEFNSRSFSTPSTFDNQTFYSASTNATNQFDAASTPGTTGGWKQVVDEAKDVGNKSPVRESLETRITNLLRKNCVGRTGTFFSDVANNQDPNFLSHPVLNNHEHTFHRRNSQKKIDDSDAILGTPPSPFVSASEYLKWHQVTKEIDSKDDSKNQNSDSDKNHINVAKKRHNQDSKNDDVDDDDRMSLSSLSSGENKLQDNSVITNQINYNDLSSMINTWNSSDAYNPLAANTMFPQYMYHSFTTQPAFSFFNSFMPTSMPSMPPVFDLNEIRSRIAKSKEDILKELLDDTLTASIKDLKEILRKDIYKKIVENFSFKIFDQWWEESERKYRLTSDSSNTVTAGGDRENKHAEQRPSSPFRIQLPFLKNPIFENSIQNRPHQMNSSNFEYGVSRGLRAAMGKMPSFKRKIIKPKSPIDDKLSDISDDDLEDRRTIRRRPYKRIPHRRKRSDSSDSLPSRHHRRHHSDKSDSSSTSSSSSHSSSSSASSSSSSGSESDSSSSSSSTSSGSSSSSSKSSSEEESDEDENGSSASVSVSASADEESGSESDASKSSSVAVSSVASAISSTISKKSQASKYSAIENVNEKDSESETKVQIMIPTREAIEKISPKHVDEEEDNVSDSDSSRTLSADETKKCEEELRLRESRMNFDDLKQSKTREEFEASEALISLAESWFEQTSGEDLIQQSSTDLKLLKPLTLNDLIQIEHNYCIQIPQEPSPIPSPVAKRKRQSKKVLSETKRKKKKGELITDENVTPNVLAVASEWRKAKRKSVRQPELVSSENIMINDENQLLGNEIKSLPPPPSITFEKRDAKMEESILFEFLDVGLESEDIGYLKRRYHQLLEEDNSNLTWLNDIHWVDHPATYWQPPKKKRKDDSLARIHETGCARSEGYYKLDRMEKMHHIANIPIASNEMEDPNRPKQIVTTQQLTREARNQRRLYNLVEQQVSSYHTDLLKLNQLKFRKKQVKFARSKIHVWGLFAMQPIPPDEMVIEYIGQRIRPMVAEIREKKYLNAGSSYLFKIDSDTIIDATHCGNVARFINHSCNPNCYAKVITVEGQKRIVIYSKQTIEVGQEITYDYKFPIEDDNKIPCLCRSVGCRGYLN